MALSVASPMRAFEAVEMQMKTLCLREFPCGKGSWREPQQENVLKKIKRKSSKSGSSLDPESLDAIKIQAQKEKSEALQELVSSHFSPWHLDYSWSKEAKELREIAVKSPWLIDDRFVQNYFKTLRIVDRNIVEVDENLLKLRNLQELTLSANHIKNINSKNLPSTLKVLELCANKISDLSGLCVRPPLLHHLGLGRNKVSFLGDYITGDYWPNLLSLDLSHNDLCDLLDIIRKMITLPKLKNLILQGNPLSLIPGYRGYTIDSLRRLSIMDDIHISADEKHHFKGLARRKEFILDEAKVQLGITYIKGLPCPEEIKNPDQQPEYPVVERTYFVQFFFPEERCVKTEEGAIVDDLADFTALDMENAAAEHQDLEESEEHSVLRAASSKSKSTTSQAQVERNVLFDSRPQMKSAEAFSVAKSSTASFPKGKGDSISDVEPGPGVEAIDLKLLEDVMEQEEDGKSTERDNIARLPSGVRLLPVNSDPHPWSEEQELNWTIDLTRDDLLALRDFFRQGMDFNVVEQVVLGYPMEADEQSEKDKASDTKDGKDKKKDTPKGKQKQTNLKKLPPPAKKDGKDKDKKKKKEPEVELVKSPPTFTTIASFHITLDHFLEGEFEYHNIFTKGDVPPPSTIRSSDGDDKKTDKKDGKDKKKPSPDKKKEQDKKGDGKKSPRGKEADKKGGKGKAHAEEAEDEDLPPPPLELEVTVKLHHWVTAMDSLKEEEERNNNNNDNTNMNTDMSTSRTQQQQLRKDKHGSKDNLKQL